MSSPESPDSDAEKPPPESARPKDQATPAERFRRLAGQLVRVNPADVRKARKRTLP